MDIASMSDAALRDELLKYTTAIGPVTGTTRVVYEKKLAKLRKEGTLLSNTSSGTPAAAPPKSVGRPRGRRAAAPQATAAQSDSEERSDSEASAAAAAPSKTRSAKPVTSTPIKEKKIPATRSTTVSSDSYSSSIYPSFAAAADNNVSSNIFTPIDKPGSTPPRRPKSPARMVPSPALRNTSVFSSVGTRPSASYSSPSYAPPKKNMVLDALDSCSSGEETDDHEESSREVPTPDLHRSFSSTYSRKSQPAESSFMSLFKRKPTLTYEREPGTLYDMRMEDRQTRVTKDKQTGAYKVNQKKVLPYDIPTLLIIVFSAFLIVLAVAYFATAKSEAVASTASIITGAVRDTVNLLYVYAVLPVLILVGFAVAVGVVYFVVQNRKKALAEEEAAFFDLIDLILEKLQDAHEGGKDCISIPYMRDEIFPPAKRRGAELARWERAVEWLNEKESRVATETVMLRGVESPVWKWVGQVDKQPAKWQGAAFPEGSSGKKLKFGLTRSLKVRNMYEEEALENRPELVEEIRAEILAKIAPAMPVYLLFKDVDGEGLVYMHFRTVDEAFTAQQALHCFWFNRKLVECKYIRDSRFYERFPDVKRFS